jgi:tRNA-dihydrouridine synthase B
MQLGPYTFDRPLVLAPMAGVSDRVFRAVCRAHGADYAPSEMTSSNPLLRATAQTRKRLEIAGEIAPRIVQIAGAVPAEMAAAARDGVANGAEIIDINMGCPAKRVCNRLAGSALLKDESLVREILEAVVDAVAVPVTLKTRTGWSRAARNAVRVARIAEDSGISALTLHGRTRECAYQGDAEYDTIAEVKAAVRMPVIANGDITSPEKARRVLAHTGADGLMIGRAAQGDPWLFARIRAYLTDGTLLPLPTPGEALQTMGEHIAALHVFYGEDLGLRIARKHAGWYQRWLPQGGAFRAVFNTLDSALAQINYIKELGDSPFGLRHGEAA